MKNSKQFFKLNNKLQELLSEQTEINLLLNPLINWTEKDMNYKNWLDVKYANREFDISNKWKTKVNEQKELKFKNDPNFNESILNENEIKRQIFLKLSKRKDELSNIILKITDELDTLTGNHLSSEEMENILSS